MTTVIELVDMRKGWQGGCVYWSFWVGLKVRNGFNCMVNGVCVYAFVLRESGLGGWVGSVCVRAYFQIRLYGALVCQREFDSIGVDRV